jgi:protein-tyrosine phosphatase
VRDLRLTHIINICLEHSCVFSEKIKYMHLPLEDMEDVILKDHFEEAISFIETALEQSNHRVLVHCHLGISRSTTIVLAYLMKAYNSTLLSAFKFLRYRRPIVCPNPGFLQQLLDFEIDLFSQPHSDINDPIFR